MSELLPRSSRIEVSRHGHKDAEGNLSTEGILAAQAEAGVIFERILAADKGTIFYVVPSNVSRSQETRGVIESSLVKLLNECSDGTIVLHKFDDRLAPKLSRDNKYILTDLPPNESIGFQSNDSTNNLFATYKELFKNEEEFVAKSWVAQAYELTELQEDIKRAFPTLTKEEYGSVKPSRWDKTPEEVAIQHLQAIEQVTLTLNSLYPEFKLVGTYIGHAPAVDFVAMSTLGQEITLGNYKKINGLRNFLESSSMQIDQGQMTSASFRGRSLVNPVSLEEVVARLNAQSRARKARWVTSKQP